MIARGVPERALQQFLGHADVRSTRRYALLADSALLQVLRPPRPAPAAADLPRTCPAVPIRVSKSLIENREMVEAAGIELGR